MRETETLMSDSNESGANCLDVTAGVKKCVTPDDATDGAIALLLPLPLRSGVFAESGRKNARRRAFGERYPARVHAKSTSAG
jgi:hypothetical protein